MFAVRVALLHNDEFLHLYDRAYCKALLRLRGPGYVETALWLHLILSQRTSKANAAKQLDEVNTSGPTPR